MTEHDDTHEQNEVRRLLAGAAGPAPELPADVGARLDDVLAGLVAERAQGGQPEGEVARPSGVTELAPRRRRWPQLLVAAAAVSVVGIGIGTVMDGGVMGGADMESVTTAESGAGAADDGRSRLDSREATDEKAVPPTADREETPQSAREPGYPAELASGLKRSSLNVDAQRIEDFGLAAPVAQTRGRWSEACVRPSTRARDEWLPVRLDGERAVLVLRAPADGRRTVDVFTCGDASSPVASTEVDAR
ncbi:MAG TPA: hypothetical protein VLB29_15380 [Nocardioidaceae bacterium]|nr:hypothetical protein [Nocardioidaceae bacterium]